MSRGVSQKCNQAEIVIEPKEEERQVAGLEREFHSLRPRQLKAEPLTVR